MKRMLYALRFRVVGVWGYPEKVNKIREHQRTLYTLKRECLRGFEESGWE